MNLVTTSRTSKWNVLFSSLAICLALGSLCNPALAAGSFSLNASQLQFNTNTGAQATQQITATNTTGFPITLAVAMTGSTNFALASSPTVIVDGSGNTTINVTYAPSLAGSDTGTLRVISSAGDTMSVPLYGTATVGSNLHLTFSPSGTINLNTRVGTPDTQAITITNTGSTATALSLAVTGTGASNYSLSSSNLAIAAGGSSSVNVVYTPTTSGTSNASLMIITGTGDTTSIPLHGTANAAMSFQLVPSGTIVFNTRPGQLDTQTVTLRNTSGLVSSYTLTPSGSSLFSGKLGSATVVGNGSTTIPITFMSNANGTSTGSILVTNVTTGDTMSIPLVAHVNYAPNLSISTPTTVSFQSRTGVQQCLPITLSNNNASAATISNIQITGDTTDFKVSGSGSTQLNSYGSGDITVCFTPTFQQGLRVANLTFSYAGTTDSSLHGTGSVTLLGTATGGVTGSDSTFFMTTRVLNYNNVQVGQTECQTVVISNPTASAVTIDSAYMSGSGSQFVITGGNMLNVGAGTLGSFNVCYVPNVAGNTNTTLNLTYTGNGGATGTIKIPVIANAVDSLNSNGGEFTNCVSVRHAIGVIGPILRGGTDSSTVYITNRTNSALTVSGATVGGTNSGSFSVAASQFPMTIQAGQQSALNVAFTPDNSITGSSYNGTATLSLTGAGVQCQNVTIQLHGVAVPQPQAGAHTDINLGTGLTSNGTTVIPITNNGTTPCVTDTVSFTNTTNAAMTISNVMLGYNPNITLMGTSMGNVSVTNPITLNAGSSLQVYFQYCAPSGVQTGKVISDQLYVQTNQSIQPQQYTIQATQIQPEAGVTITASSAVNIAILPNPTSDRVEIRVADARSANVEVFDLLGNVLQTMHGSGVINWDGHDAAGAQLPSGVYVVRVTGTDANGTAFRESRQLVISR